MIPVGPENLHAMLDGFHQLDEHFRATPFASNLPVLMGLPRLWHSRIPLCQHLHGDSRSMRGLFGRPRVSPLVTGSPRREPTELQGISCVSSCSILISAFRAAENVGAPPGTSMVWAASSSSCFVAPCRRALFMCS